MLATSGTHPLLDIPDSRTGADGPRPSRVGRSPVERWHA
jgi:hypothetical protein